MTEAWKSASWASRTCKAESEARSRRAESGLGEIEEWTGVTELRDVRGRLADGEGRQQKDVLGTVRALFKASISVPLTWIRLHFYLGMLRSPQVQLEF